MRNERRKQVITMSILIGAVLLISVGFAAFSSILTIESNVTYTPDSDVFQIKFSKTSNSILDGANNPVNPVSGNGGSAIIVNQGTPTITNLHAHFTSPGQSVVYEFYAVNESPYDAYLTLINYLNIGNGKGTKECVAKNGATEALVTKACEGISVKVEVGTTLATQTTEVENHKLGKGTSEKVRVTISYTGQAIDGSMDITFGDISLIYGTADEQVEELPETDATLYTGTIYRNSTDVLYVGQDIKYRWCAVVPGVANSCVENEYFNQIFRSETECETTLEQIAKSGDLDETTQYLIDNAVCEQETRPLSYETSPLNINKNNYLKHEVTNNIVTASYACITYTENGTRKDTCLRGYDPTYYVLNQSILRSVESYFNTLSYGSGTGSCYFNDSHSNCSSGSLYLFAYSDGFVDADGGFSSCGVDSDGTSYCNE